jgi:hypothetical protein
MFQLIRALSTQNLVRPQIPAFSISFVITSLFYRFGNFTVAGLLIRMATTLKRHRPT